MEKVVALQNEIYREELMEDRYWHSWVNFECLKPHAVLQNELELIVCSRS
jgi:hypothetical protein